MVMYGSHNIFLGLGGQYLPEGKVTHILGQRAPVPPHHVQPLLLLNLISAMQVRRPSYLIVQRTNTMPVSGNSMSYREMQSVVQD